MNENHQNPAQTLLRKGFDAIRDLHLREIIDLQQEQIRLLTRLLEDKGAQTP